MDVKPSDEAGPSPQTDWIRLQEQQTALFEVAVTEADTLRSKVKDLEREISVWKLAHRVVSEEKDSITKKAVRLEHEIGKWTSDKPLVVALIDGDGHLFTQDLFEMGQTGGRQAAMLLRESLFTYITEENPGIANRAELLLTIFWNAKGLKETLIRNRVCTGEQFEGFCYGFNQSAHLFSIVDAGFGKEAADTKIKEHIRLFAHFPQTEFVFFGGGHDNGYTATLTSLETEGLLRKVVLIRGYADLAQEIKHLNLKELSIASLFMTRKLSLYSPFKPAAKPLPLDVQVPQYTPSLSSNDALSISDAQSPPIYNDRFSHDVEVTPSMLDTMRQASRKTPCSYENQPGKQCTDKDCTWGHSCPFGPKCSFLNKPGGYLMHAPRAPKAHDERDALDTLGLHNIQPHGYFPGNDDVLDSAMAISDYEKQRNANIARNKLLLEALELDRPQFEPVEDRRKPRPKKRKADDDSSEVKPTQEKRAKVTEIPEGGVRRSGRNAGKTIDYKAEIVRAPVVSAAVQSGLKSVDDAGPAKRSTGKRIHDPKKFGSIPGVAVGTWWETREECSCDAIHAPWVAGISGGPDGAYSVALSGGYDDDVDLGYAFTYTGSGGRDLKGTKAKPKNLRTAPQSCDQSFENSFNKALKKSSETRKPVRVIRGYKLQSKYAPSEGYRYDGLYIVDKAWMEKGLNPGGFLVCKYTFKRMPGQPALPVRATDSSSDDADADAPIKEDSDAEDAPVADE
ncbi:hypothetical protein ONZ45_g907 [Pleurotus djamor]|nr:hypothetical protein ONZ45_g907 [Pleurotus djamor]